jgi:4-aminobutyrate aminotransferase-like enzyme/Ser/Thr protein kinase RdoA (MazF antagonist)
MALLAHRPKFDATGALRIARERFELPGALASPLPSERDQNFRIETDTGARFVLKIANATDDRALLAAQHEALERIALVAWVCPRPVRSARGETLVEVQDAEGARHLAWLTRYLEGAPLATVRRQTGAVLEDLGRRLGQIDRALLGWDAPAFRREFHWDVAQAAHVVGAFLPLVADASVRGLVERVAAGAFARVERHAASLRRGVIHNDANDHNVLVGGGHDLYSRNQQVTGILDFGDMVESYLAAEPAVAIAYAVLDKADPLASAAAIVRGYHAEVPLHDADLATVFDLACLRICMSVCIAADQQRQQPGDPYLSVSQAAIARTLPRLARIPPGLAEAVLRHACALPPVPTTPAVEAWLRSTRESFAPPLGVDLRSEPCVVVDLGVASPLVDGDPGRNAERYLTERLGAAMASAGATVGVGQYDEPRLLYTSPVFASGVAEGETRTIHVGLDLFAPAGTPVHAPLDGVVHLVTVNDGPLDYGGVVILRHEARDRGTGAQAPSTRHDLASHQSPGTRHQAPEFFTLYGHLSPSSLEGLRVGAPVAAGQRIATLGAPGENGGWTPHLHLQVITDLLGLGADFPGVVAASQRDVWLALSLDPTLIAGLPAERFPERRPDARETLATRRARLGGNLSLAYREPLKIERGWRQYLFDHTGRRFLDAYNNVPHVGHCHPRVVAAGQAQMAVLNTNTRYLHDLVNRYAERLAATLPAPLRVCYFVNSASEANELALRLARAHTGQRDTIVLEAAYHGHTTSLIDISPYKHAGPGGHGAPVWVHTAPLPDTYRGPHRREDPAAGTKYARAVTAILERLRERRTGLAAFIAETCPSVGGQIFFPAGYLAEVYAAVRAAGGVCIADEVQTGLGRIGTHFWAFEAHGVVPDIVVMGKPLGNGHPIGAVVTTREIASSFDNGMEFFSTFGGNPVSAAVGLAVLDVVQEERLQQHALEVGEHLLGALRPLADRYPLVGDVRGSGLFLGVELVRDRDTREPATDEAGFISNRMRDRGILLGTDGPHHNVIKIRPPMPFSLENAELLAATLDEILAEDFGSP